jgi:hypothetical protein
MSKSRWKGALLATVAASVLTPFAAKAQTMNLSLSLSPLGDTSAYGGSGFVAGTAAGQVGGYAQGPATSEYIPPDQQTPIYVYATVTGTQAMTSSYVNGLQFAYFNVLDSAGINPSEGTIVSATPNATLGFAAYGSQGGSTNLSSGTLAVGSQSALTSIAKPRSASAVWSTKAADGTNVIVSGDSVSFLIETLEYKPASTSSSYTGNGGSSVTFTLGQPALSTATPYVESNYFVGSPSAINGSVGASYTHTTYGITGTGVTLIDAEPGDINLDGTVDINDFGVLAGNFGTATPGWVNGDLNGDGVVDINDFGILAQNFGTSEGGLPTVALPTALIGGGSTVPEPTTGMILAIGAAASVLRRRKAR